MPAVYAHHLFGKEVLKKLPNELSYIIKAYGTPFQIGLQGPDILFFYNPLSKNPINQKGYAMHKQPAKDFLARTVPVVRKKGTCSPEYAYLLGFICHFMLDSTCHPFVEEQVKTHSLDHIEIESEFEKFLLANKGIPPLSYPVYRLIPTDAETAQCISHIYQDIPAKDIKKALQDMYLYKKILTAPNKGKRTLLKGIMLASGQYDSLQGHILNPVTPLYAGMTNQKLLFLFRSAIEEAAVILKDFHESITKGKELHERFNRNFD